MKQIKKFQLKIEPTQKVMIPFNAEIIHFGVFNKNPCLWAICDEGRDMERSIVIYADSKDLAQTINSTKHLGSFEHGGHVLHAFEE